MIHKTLLILGLTISVLLLLFGYRVIDIDENLHLKSDDYDKIVISGYVDLSICLSIIFYKCCVYDRESGLDEN